MVSPNDITNQTIFQQSPLSTQIFSPGGISLMANKAWEKLWGVKHKLIGNYNILKDQQLVEKGIMSYIERGFKGEIIQIPAIKYVPSETLPNVNTVPFRWVKALMYPVKNKKGQIINIVLQHEDITERKKYEEQTAQLAAIVESSADAIVSKRLDGVITSWNHTAEKLFGYKAKEAIGQNIRMIIPADLQNEEDKIISKIRRGISVDHFETVRRHKTGKLIPISLTISPIKDKEGTIIGASKIARDITLPKAMEEILRTQKEQLEIILKSIADGITVQAPNGSLIYANNTAAKLIGYSSVQELLKTPPVEIMKKFEVMDEFGNPFPLNKFPGRLALQGLRSQPTIVRFRVTNTRQEHWSIVKATPVFDEKKKVLFAINVFHDMTAFKQAEERIKQSEERFRLAISAGKIGIWDWDIENNYITWSERIYKIFGVGKKDFTGKFEDFEKLIYVEDRDEVKEAIQNAWESKDNYEIEFRATGPKGKLIWLSTSARVVFDEKKKPIRMLGAMIDITQRKNLENQKEEFMSIASHELKTPITSLKVFTEILERDFLRKGDKHTAKLLRKMDMQIDKLTKLISDLLDITRIGEGKLIFRKDRFDFNLLVMEIVEEVQRTTPKHKIVVELSPTRRITGDRDRYGQVMTNFLTNAIKYSPKADRIIVRAIIKEKNLIFSVQDFGIGIVGEKHSQVFERFFRIHNDVPKTFPGLGLGLHISSEIIKRQGGKIWLESKKGQGSTFFFSISLN
jgi:PAS domain S-box-containing protein